MVPALPLVVHGIPAAARVAYSAYRTVAPVGGAVPFVMQAGRGAEKSVIRHSAAVRPPFKSLAKDSDVVGKSITSAKLKQGGETNPSPKPPFNNKQVGGFVGATVGAWKSYLDWNPEVETWRNMLNSAVNIGAGVPWGMAAASYPVTAVFNGAVGLALGQHSDGTTLAGVVGAPVSYLIPNIFGGWVATHPAYFGAYVATGIFGLVAGAAPRLTGVKE